MTRIFDIREPSMAALRDAPVYFRYGSNRKRVLVDRLTANAVIAVYDALQSADAKAKLERMVAGSYSQFSRVVEFSWKHVRVG
jgi:hypothetical protein